MIGEESILGLAFLHVIQFLNYKKRKFIAFNRGVINFLFLSSNMVRVCGNSQAEIAKDIAEYEMEVEQNIIAPFQNVIEVTNQFENQFVH